MNRGYVFPGYLTLFRDYALRPKEPVVHPALHLQAPPLSVPLADNDPGAPSSGGSRAA
jgi:hypothetical protein